MENRWKTCCSMLSNSNVGQKVNKQKKFGSMSYGITVQYVAFGVMSFGIMLNSGLCRNRYSVVQDCVVRDSVGVSAYSIMSLKRRWKISFDNAQTFSLIFNLSCTVLTQLDFFLDISSSRLIASTVYPAIRMASFEFLEVLIQLKFPPKPHCFWQPLSYLTAKW